MVISLMPSCSKDSVAVGVGSSDSGLGNYNASDEDTAHQRRGRKVHLDFVSDAFHGDPFIYDVEVARYGPGKEALLPHIWFVSATDWPSAQHVMHFCLCDALLVGAAYLACLKTQRQTQRHR